MTEFVYTATHRLYYDTKNPVPIADIIDGLQGLERVLSELPNVLGGVTKVPINRLLKYRQRTSARRLAESLI